MVKLRKKSKSPRQLLLERKKQRRKRIISFLGYFLLSGIFLFTIFVWLSYRDFLNLKAVVIKGDYKKAQILRDFIYKQLEKDSFLLSPTFLFSVDEKFLTEQIEKNFYDIKSAQISLDIENRVLIAKIVKRNPKYLLCYTNNKQTFPQHESCKYYLADDEFTVYKPLKDPIEPYLPVYIFSEPPESLPKELAHKKLKEAILFLEKNPFFENKSPIYLKFFDRQLFVYYPEFFIKLDVTENLELARENYIHTIKHFKKQFPDSKIKYVDLRIPSKIFINSEQEELEN